MLLGAQPDAVTVIASSSGSAPANGTASANAVTPSRAEAADRFAANVSAPPTIRPTPLTTGRSVRIAVAGQMDHHFGGWLPRCLAIRTATRRTSTPKTTSRTTNAGIDPKDSK